MMMTTKAIITQLRAEVIATYGSQKAFSEASGIEYYSLTRYLSEDRAMPLTVLIQALEALKLDPVSFFVRAQQRADQDAENAADLAGRKERS